MLHAVALIMAEASATDEATRNAAPGPAPSRSVKPVPTIARMMLMTEAVAELWRSLPVETTR